MASIFDLAPLEEGGPIARGGFKYQDHVAAAFCLEMVRNDQIQAVWCETQDDIILDKTVAGQRVVELVQVKSDQLDQLWSIAKLCGRDTKNKAEVVGSSILEKQLAKDRGDESTAFRLVTLRDANTELSVLKVPHDEHYEAQLRTLIGELNKRLGNCASPKGNNLEYWARNAVWDVRESPQALENSNLRALDEYLAEIGHPLLLDQKLELYGRIVDRARDMAEARWANGVQHKHITRQALRQWLENNAIGFPTALQPEVAHELANLERESLARCEARWLTLGVPEDLARHFANNPSVGAPSADLIGSLQRPFAWLVGDFGTGKSLVLERVFQRQVAAFRAGGAARLPVLLEAKRVSDRALRNEAEAQARRIGDIARRGVLLLVDGIDEAGTEASIDLLTQAYVLSRTWPNSSVVITSRPFPSDAFNETRVTLPLLSNEGALEIIRSISGNSFPSIHYVPEAFQSDVARPLFAVLFALAWRESQQWPSSTGELISRVADRALQPLINTFAGARDLLVRLAIRSTDRGGGPVAATDVAGSALGLQPLIGTRLVAEERGAFSFTIGTLAHWFAAEGLRRGEVRIGDLVADPARLENWRFPLAALVGTSSFAAVSPVLDALARNNPAFAGVVLKDAVREWHARVPVCPQPEELANQIQTTVLAWRDGFGILAPAIFPSKTDGEPKRLAVSVGEGRVTCYWHDDPSLSQAAALPQAPAVGVTSGAVWCTAIGDQPAWVWRHTQRNASSELSSLVRQRAFFLDTGPLAREAAWNEACERMVRSRFRDERISLAELAQTRARFLSMGAASRALEAETQRLRHEHQDVLIAPCPQADQEPASAWITAFFSVDRVLARIHAVYQAALPAYKQMVDKYFGKFAPRLKHYAVLPVRITGVVVAAQGQQLDRGNSYSCTFEPLRRGEQSQIEFRLGTSNESRELFAAWEAIVDSVKRLRPEAAMWMGAFGFGGGIEEICQPDPCSRIVYRWLEEDLRAVNWLT